MVRTVNYSHIDTVLDDLEYPVTRDHAVDTLSDVTLFLADGEVNLGELITETTSDSFQSRDDLQSELNNTLPREAVGEPYQSEGEG